MNSSFSRIYLMTEYHYSLTTYYNMILATATPEAVIDVHHIAECTYYPWFIEPIDGKQDEN